MPGRELPDPRVQMFARFVDRALKEARDRGMDTDEIEKRTGLGRATIYRWRRGATSSPQRRQVQQFTEGLGIPMTVPAQILGWDGKPPSVDPEPSIDPDLQAVMRRLNDPDVSREEKTAIRATLRYLAKGGV